VADFARNVCAKLLPESSPRGVSVMIETLSSALSRAVQKKVQPTSFRRRDHVREGARLLRSYVLVMQAYTLTHILVLRASLLVEPSLCSLYAG
jgi:hypothetical protein